MSNVAELVAQWREQKLSGLGLLRGLVSHPKWTVLISDNAAAQSMADGKPPALQIFDGPDGQKWLLYFSSAETLDVYIKANSIPASQRVLTATGPWIFRLEFRGIDRVWIDPSNAHEISYEKSQFPMLNDMADAVMVEEALLGLRQGKPPANAIQRVRQYKNYFVMVKFTNGKSGMVIAPDGQGRRLAAVFTATEGFDRFAREVRVTLADIELRQLRFDGVDLFKTLNGMNMDGFVFNCSGPTTPVAFAQQAAALFMQEPQPQTEPPRQGA